MTGIGVVIAFGLYYGFYVVSLLTTTLPALLNGLAQGKSVGQRVISLKGFWPTLQSHFNLLPFIITIAILGLISWWRFRPPSSTSRLPLSGADSEDRSVLQLNQEISLPSLLLYLAWLGTFGIFSLIVTRVNLFQKEMLFAIPLFALGTGLFLTLLVEYIKISPLPFRQTILFSLKPEVLKAFPYLRVSRLIYLVIGWYVVNGCYLWYSRVIYYVLAAGTG